MDGKQSPRTMDFCMAASKELRERGRNRSSVGAKCEGMQVLSRWILHIQIHANQCDTVCEALRLLDHTQHMVLEHLKTEAKLQ